MTHKIISINRLRIALTFLHGTFHPKHSTAICFEVSLFDISVELSPFAVKSMFWLSSEPIRLQEITYPDLFVARTDRSNYQKNKLHMQHSFLSFPCRCFARLQRCFVRLRAYLHEGGRPQVGEVKCVKLPHLTCKRDHIKMRLFGQVGYPTSAGYLTSLGTPPPCKQALKRQTS